MDEIAPYRAGKSSDNRCRKIEWVGERLQVNFTLEKRQRNRFRSSIRDTRARPAKVVNGFASGCALTIGGGTSAADLKFLHHLPQVRSGTSNR
jgi:hypothetical protein